MKKILALSVVAMALVGCQSTQQESKPVVETSPAYLECNFGGEYYEVAAPKWKCEPNTNREMYAKQASGSSANKSGGVAHQRQLAILDANRTLAGQFKTDVIATIKSSSGTLGIDGAAGGAGATKDVSEALVNFKLKGTEIIRTMTGPNGHVYVHVGMPRAALQQNIDLALEVVQENAPNALPTNVTPAQNKQLSDDIAKALEGM